jgi:regulator of nucleoside diphosphate kinase
MHKDILVITELDAARIRQLVARSAASRDALDPFLDLMAMLDEKAHIVPGRCIPPDVVTVNSTVSFRDEATGGVHRVTLVYPHETSIAEGQISILSPVGRALLGLPVGRTAAVELPDGSTKEIRILELHYQPEAAGEFTR